jgi:alkaline phosphatase
VELDYQDRPPSWLARPTPRLDDSPVKSLFRFPVVLVLVALAADTRADHFRDLQIESMRDNRVSFGYWGTNPKKYSEWKSHSNRLIPIYAFGVKLANYTGVNSVYRDAVRIEQLYGFAAEHTHNPQAEYCDQTDVYRLQRAALAAGKKYIVLVVFDGMDWQTTRAASIARLARVAYAEGRGTGLHFQDYRAPVNDFGYCVTAPHNEGTKLDVDAQVILQLGQQKGGYDWRRAGLTPWQDQVDLAYLTSKAGEPKQAYTDSSSAATSLCTGIKTYNDSVNVDYHGKQVETIAHVMQRQGFAVGIVTSVPISHATPACAYAHNVFRDDYQDLTRDLLGLRSVAHREQPLPGVDVLIGGGWGEDSQRETADDQKKIVTAQGRNFVPGNKYLTDDDLNAIDASKGGRYRVALRTKGQSGPQVLSSAAREARDKGQRLFGLFGVRRGHLPFRTADGDYHPTSGIACAEQYTAADLYENPTLADMTESALEVLSANPKGFWLMVEAGDVDWGNHDNNLDNAVGAVISGDEAFKAVVDWVDAKKAWDETAVIVTSDHGHLLMLSDPEKLVDKARLPSRN